MFFAHYQSGGTFCFAVHVTFQAISCCAKLKTVTVSVCLSVCQHDCHLVRSVNQGRKVKDAKRKFLD